MIAGILHTLGVNMGTEFIEKHWSNPLGHFEDKDFVLQNRQILQAVDGSWNKPPAKESILQVRQRFEKQIRDLIKQKKSPFWGWKDPRTVLTIDLYLPYLNNPHFIICSRNTESIAQSIVRRDGISISEAEMIISEYEGRIKDFIAENRDIPVLNIAYENALERPENLLESLTDFLNIPVSEDVRQKAMALILPKEEIRRLSLRVKRKESIKNLIRKNYRKITGNLKKIKEIF